MDTPAEDHPEGLGVTPGGKYLHSLAWAPCLERLAMHPRLWPIVLERTDEPLAGDNPLGRDIRTALNKSLVIEGHPIEEGFPAIAAKDVPRLFNGIYGLGSRDFRPEHIIGAYEYATAGRARSDGRTAEDGASFFVLGVPHPYEVKAEEAPSLLPQGAISVRFH